MSKLVEVQHYATHLAMAYQLYQGCNLIFLFYFMIKRLNVKFYGIG